VSGTKKTKSQSKQPALHLYGGDIFKDPLLGQASMISRCAWYEVLMLMWECDRRGELTTTPNRLKQLVRAQLIEEVLHFLNEMHEIEFGDIIAGNGVRFPLTESDCNTKVTLINRRMHSDFKDRQNTRLRQRKHRAKKGVTDESQNCHADVTPSLSTTTSIASNKVSKDTYVGGPKKTPCPHNMIIEAYHLILPEMPRIKVWNDTSRSWLGARWKEEPLRQNIEWWEDYFRFVRESPFLIGQVKTWMADLLWLVRASNFAKVLNGVYHKNINKIELRPTTVAQAQVLEGDALAKWLLMRLKNENVDRSDDRGGGETVRQLPAPAPHPRPD